MKSKVDLAADIAQCGAQRIDPEWISMDEGSLLLLLLQKCLPLAYSRKGLYRFVRVSSTTACPEHSGKDRLNNDRSCWKCNISSNWQGGNGQLTWPRTDAGSTTRSRPSCLDSWQQFVHRRCLDNFHRGPHWGPVMVFQWIGIYFWFDCNFI